MVSVNMLVWQDFRARLSSHDGLPKSMFVTLCYSGIPRSLAKSVALQTVKGSALIGQQETAHLSSLRDSVTTPKGTTISGLVALEKRAFRAAGRYLQNKGRPPY